MIPRLYTLTAFWGAVLLFQVQPMMSKALLPAFGGSYLVWGACMVFYQGALLLGYLYAHVAQRALGVLGYARWHPWFLALGFLALLVSPRVAEMQAPAMPPVFQVFYCLAAAIGLPFFALSTVSVTLQRWYSVDARTAGRNPYALYSASNVGSALGLLAYPFAVEILLDLNQQWTAWWAGYAVLVALHVICRPRRAAPAAANAGDERAAAAPSAATLARWFLPSAAGSAMLLAVTNVITLDVASVPFLWVLPLAVYLLTFVAAFRDPIWFPAWCRRAYGVAVLAGLLLVLLSALRLTCPVPAMVPLQLAILFIVCLNCHGRLASIKPPDARHLTTFYLILALGGVAGSMLVTWVVPVVSTSLVEYPVALWLSCAGLLAAGGRASHDDARPLARASFTIGAAASVLALTALPWFAARLRLPPAVLFTAAALPLALFALLAARRLAWLALAIPIAVIPMRWTPGLYTGGDMVLRHRNYYGIYRVFDVNNQRVLQHGTTVHGSQYLSGPLADRPTGYYHPDSPAARLVASDLFGLREVAMIGLGTGALPWYAPSGSTVTIYELDPDNLPIARRHFSYLDMAEQHGARLRFVFGDGRIRLRGVPDGAYDLFVIDAFNSGSIPVHLLTVEALREYFRVLRPDGILLIHISNRVLDLAPVVRSIARALDMPLYFQTVTPDEAIGRAETHWAMLTRREDAAALAGRLGWSRADLSGASPRPWTDHFSNLFGALVF